MNRVPPGGMGLSEVPDGDEDQVVNVRGENPQGGAGNVDAGRASGDAHGPTEVKFEGTGSAPAGEHGLSEVKSEEEGAGV